MSAHLFPMHHSEAASGAVDSRVIDDSMRLPVLILFGSALHWLIAAALVSVVLSIELFLPGLLGGISFLSYGRLAPIARDLFLYGWASQAALAAGIWLTARLAGRPLASSPFGGVLQSTLIISATVLWNLAVLLGSLAILAGYSTGVEWLEYPTWASATLFLAFLLIGIWALLLFDRRTNERAEVAQWYLVAGFCSFPWIYGTANLLLTWKPVQASAQGPIQAWFHGSFLSLWLLPVALAALYALIPRILGAHLHRRNLAPLGFWSLLLLGGWSGLGHLIGGPVPAWMTAGGVVSSALFLIPVVIILINLLGIVLHHPEKESQSLSFRFLIFGTYAFLVLGVLSALISWPDISGIVRFTGVTEAETQLWILGAISLPLLGVLYEAIPQLLGRDCWCRTLADLHYWLTVVGFWLLVGVLALEGFFTGLALSDPTVSFLNIASYAYPFYVLEAAANLILLSAAAILGINMTRALAGDYFFPKK